MIEINRGQFLIGFTLFGTGMMMLGYYIGCLKTRSDMMEAIARSMANNYGSR